MKKKLLLLAILAMLAPFLAAQGAQAQSPEDFGYGSMTVNGEDAHGGRPLLVIMVNYADTDFRSYHTEEFYYKLIFGYGGSALPVGDGSGRNVSVYEYYKENSRGSFGWWSLVVRDVYGPYTISDDPGTDWNEGLRDQWWNDSADAPDDRPGRRARENLFARTTVGLADDDVDFSSFDWDGNGELTGDELTVVVIGPGPKPADGGSARWTCAAERLKMDGVKVCLSAALVGEGEGVGLATLDHELAHLLGTVDIYGSASRSIDLSIMSSTIFGVEDDRSAFHLDPWHKIQLGWATPRI